MYIKMSKFWAMRLFNMIYSIFQPQIKIEKNGKFFYVNSIPYPMFWKQLQSKDW